MKYIGTKHLLSFCLVSIATLILYLSWNKYVDQLPFMTSESLILISLFSLVTGYLIVRLWRLDEPSLSVIGVKRPPSDPSETVLLSAARWVLYIGPNPRPRRLIPRLFTRIVYVYIMAVIALHAFNNRSIVLISEFSESLTWSSGEFCSDEEKKVDRPEKIGCDFLLRAYRLGYVEDLADCEPEDMDVPVEEQICWLRQTDEPYLHYQWRKLSRFFQNIDEKISFQSFKDERRKLSMQLEHVETIVKPFAQAMNTDPRASHHIFTNLPRPDRSFFRMPAWLQPNRCIQDYGQLSHSLPDGNSDSDLFEYTSAQLLFQSRHASQAGFCREYFIHWDSKLDVCDRIIKDPEDILDELAVLSKVNAVIDRYQTQRTIEGLRGHIDFFKIDVSVFEANREAEASRPEKNKKPRKAEIRPHNAISFNCLFVGSGETFSKERPARMHGFDLSVRTAWVEADLSKGAEQRRLDYFDPLAGLMTDNFHYSRLASREGLAQLGAKDAYLDSFNADSYPLTQLESVFNADLLLGHQWMLDRPDLLEIYPWYKHLYNFIRRFREEYKENRGRL